MKDYRTIESELRTVADEFSKTRAVNSPFKGTNFMTSDVVTRRKGKHGVWFELSYGRGMSNEWIFGVTFADFDGTEYGEKSGCCHTLGEVRDRLTSVIG